MGLFIISFFQKKKKQQKIIKISVIACISLILLLLIIRIVDYFTISFAIKNITTTIQGQNNAYKVSYDKSYNILTSTIKLSKLKISISEGDFLIKKANIKKASGFLIPNTINIVVDSIISNDTINSKQNILQPYNGNININITFNQHFFKPSTIRGIKILKPVYANIINVNNNKKIGDLKIDESIFEFKNNGSTLLLKQHGSFLLLDENIKDLFIIKFGLPFKWDIDMAESVKQETWGINNEHTENVSYVDVKNIAFDYGYSSVFIKGTTTRDKNIRMANMELIINNDDKLMNNIFNMVLQYGNIESKIVKQLYYSIKNNLIPMLKTYSNIKEKNKLYLKIIKTEDDDLKINNISLDEIVKTIDIK